jgi:hypothetical protein
VEAVANKGTTLTSLTNENNLTDGMITRMQGTANMPVNDNVLALVDYNTAVLPVDTSKPVAIGSRGGNTCLTHQGKN